MHTHSYKARTAFLLLCAVCLFVPASLRAQDVAPGAASSSQTAITLSTDQSSILLPSADPASQDSRSPSAVWLFVRMVLVLAVVVALIYAVMRFMRKTTAAPDSDDPFLRRVSSLSLGQGKSVQVVTLLDHAYLVGVSDAGVQLIGEVADKELVDSMNLFADKNDRTKKPRSFSDVLELFMPMAGRTAPAQQAAPEMTVAEDEAPASSISVLRNRLNEVQEGAHE